MGSGWWSLPSSTSLAAERKRQSAMAMNDQHEKPDVSDEVLQLPAPTAWPLVLAFGLTFAFAGLVTNGGISVLGAGFIVAGFVGSFRLVWPPVHHIAVPVKVQRFKYTTTRIKVARIEI